MKEKTIAALIAIVVIAMVIMFLGCIEDKELVPSTSIPDSDGDGWNDEQEEIAGTDPYNKDTDDDGYWDPKDENPLDSNIPLKQTTLTPIPTPASTPTNVYLSIPTAAFQPDSRCVDYIFSPSEIELHSVNGCRFFKAPVHLPDGAKITEMIFYWNDASDEDAELWLGRVNIHQNFETTGYYFVAHCITSGSSGVESYSTDSMQMGHVVDNSENAYFLVLRIDSPDIIVRLVTIQYIPEY